MQIWKLKDCQRFQNLLLFVLKIMFVKIRQQVELKVQIEDRDFEDFEATIKGEFVRTLCNSLLFKMYKLLEV